MVKQKHVRDLDATRHRILDAGRREFAEFGLHGARVDRIAEKSDSNKSMIYYIFGGKEDLYMAVLESLFVEKTEILDNPFFDGVVHPNHLPQIMAGFLEIVLRNKEASMILIDDVAAGAPFLKRLKQKRPELFQTFGLLSAFLQNLMENKRIESLDPDKSIVLTAAIIISVPILLPSLDILRPKGTPEYVNLTDVESWKNFLAKLLQSILKPVED
jgi:AcrR family transcriptional regulator